jgi:hypothetical protein
MSTERQRARPGQLLLALAMLFFFVAVDAPFPWSTPLYYELSFDVEPWYGPDGAERARADLAREGLTPRSLEVTWTLGLLACQGSGCNTFKAVRADFTWLQVPAALERCFTYKPHRLSLTTAFNRKDCRPIYTDENRPRSP